MDEPQRQAPPADVSPEHSQGDELVPEPLIHSFAEVGQLAVDDHAHLDLELTKSLVEDVLSGYADCDVYVDMSNEPDMLILQIGTRGTGIPYPFTSDDVYAVVDELTEIFDKEATLRFQDVDE